MLPGLFVGSFIGATIAMFVSGGWLKFIFAGFEIALGIYFFFIKSKPKTDTNNLPKGPGMALIGFFISALSTLLGISGGVIYSSQHFYFIKLELEKQWELQRLLVLLLGQLELFPI